MYKYRTYLGGFEVPPLVVQPHCLLVQFWDNDLKRGKGDGGKITIKISNNESLTHNDDPEQEEEVECEESEDGDLQEEVQLVVEYEGAAGHLGGGPEVGGHLRHDQHHLVQDGGSCHITPLSCMKLATLVRNLPQPNIWKCLYFIDARESGNWTWRNR